MKKQIPSLLLAMLLTVSLTACGVQGGEARSAVIQYGSASSAAGGPEVLPPLNLPEEDAAGAEENLPDSSQEGPDASANQAGGKSQDLGNAVDEDGWYSSKEEVALYIHLYDRLPDNYVSKKEAEEAGWRGGSVERYTGEGTAIGGSRFGNREGLLPSEKGRTYYECDIDTIGETSRGAKRIIFSSDGLIYYTEDHYESFTLLYGEE